MIRSLANHASDSSQNIVAICFSYFFYFGILGVMVPYTGVFLDGRGFSSEQIGSLLAIVTITRVFGPNLWAALADKTGKVGQILRFGCLCAFVCFLFVFVAHGYWQLSIAFGVMMMFWTAVLPQLEVVAVNASRGRKGGYGAVRLWGSLGFIALTIIVGALMDVFGSEVVIICISLCLLSLYLSTLYIKTNSQPTKAQDLNTPQWSLVFALPFIAFLFAATLLQVSFATYYNFFALYMQDHHYSGTQTGVLLAIAVACEIAIFLLATKLIKRFSIKLLLIFSFAVTALRWLLLAEVPDSLMIVLFSQCLHAFSFGLTHTVSIHFLHSYFPRSFQSRGQALYGSIAFGVGGAIGSLVSGYLWQQGEGASLSFYVSSAMAISALLLIAVTPSKRLNEVHAKDE